MFQRPNGDIGFYKEEWSATKPSYRTALGPILWYGTLNATLWLSWSILSLTLFAWRNLRRSNKPWRRNVCLILTQPRYPVETPKPRTYCGSPKDHGSSNGPQVADYINALIEGGGKSLSSLRGTYRCSISWKLAWPNMG